MQKEKELLLLSTKFFKPDHQGYSGEEKMVRYINCENAKNAEAKMVMNFFSRYEMENELPGTTDTYYFGSSEDMLNFAHTRTDYRVYHYEMYIREVNPESGVLYGWAKVEGGYSKGYYEMVSVAR